MKTTHAEIADKIRAIKSPDAAASFHYFLGYIASCVICEEMPKAAANLVLKALTESVKLAERERPLIAGRKEGGK